MNGKNSKKSRIIQLVSARHIGFEYQMSRNGCHLSTDVLYCGLCEDGTFVGVVFNEPEGFRRVDELPIPNKYILMR